MHGRVIEIKELMKSLGPLCRCTFELQAEETGARNTGDAIGAIGKFIPVKQNYPDNLAKTQGHDGQIITPQAQHRKTE